MKCKNCNSEKEMRRVINGHYYCEDCKEVYKVEGENQTPIKDKKEFFTNVLSDFEKFGKGLQDLAGNFIEKKKEEDDSEKGMFM